MAKVITFSRSYPTYHPRKGEQTDFVPKLLLSFLKNNLIGPNGARDVMRDLNMPFSEYLIEAIPYLNSFDAKGHTFRVGKTRKVGDLFSPRVWSGRPYKDPQIGIGPDIPIVKIWDWDVDANGVMSISGKYCSDKTLEKAAANDGLSEEDFREWLIMPAFRKAKATSGQILCWDKNINY